MEIVNELLEQGQFLALSRAKPDAFLSPSCFTIADHTQVTIYAAGIICFEPQSLTSKDIILSSGIHGNETAPIEICEEFVKDILLGKLVVGHRVLFIFANLKAMDLAKRFVDENMNNAFSRVGSNFTASYEYTRVKQIEQVVRHFYAGKRHEKNQQRLHYDLHTSIRTSKNEKFAIYPYLHGKQWYKSQLQMLLACGVNTILLAAGPTNAFGYFTANEFSAHSLTVELGRVRPFGFNEMSRFEKVVTTLKKLICNQPLMLKTYSAEDFFIYKVNQVINKQKADFIFNFSEDTQNFTDFPKDHLIATETGKEYRIAHSGEAIVFPNAQVEIGQRALLTVIPTSI
ncbi:succinylglutamate desuccinylase [Paraglaciecola sp. L3A3]|uniref:succinylglutamate desuccinylase n=1 Tax=Paraglaciecola sp. L3A3 TaxID=2686358 RepID=UPI00351A90E4